MGFAQGCSLVLQFLASVLLARLLTPYQMGIFAVAAATVGGLSIVQAFGLQSLIVREERLTLEISATAFSVNLLISLGLSGAILLLALAGGVFLQDDGVRRVLFVLAAAPLFGIFGFLPSANLEREGRFKAISLVTTASGFAATLAITPRDVHCRANPATSDCDDDFPTPWIPA